MRECCIPNFQQTCRCCAADEQKGGGQQRGLQSWKEGPLCAQATERGRVGRGSGRVQALRRDDKRGLEHGEELGLPLERGMVLLLVPKQEEAWGQEPLRNWAWVEVRGAIHQRGTWLWAMNFGLARAAAAFPGNQCKLGGRAEIPPSECLLVGLRGKQEGEAEVGMRQWCGTAQRGAGPGPPCKEVLGSA